MIEIWYNESYTNKGGFLGMKQMKKELAILLFCMMSIFMFAVPVMAKDVTEKKEAGKSLQGVGVEHVIKEQNSQLSFNGASTRIAGALESNSVGMARVSTQAYYLKEVLPKENAVIKRGEKLYVKFLARDTWKYYYTKPLVSVFDASSNSIVYMNFNQEKVSLSGQDTYSGYLSWDTSKAKPGKYFIFIVNAPCDANGRELSNWNKFDTPVIKTNFTLVNKPAHKHSFGSWKTVKAATVFATGKKECKCKSCNQKKTQTIPKLKPTIKLSATNKTIARNKYYTLSITKLAKGDSIKSVRSNNTGIATVKKMKTNQYRITGKKKGTTTVTVVLKSGKKATCKIIVK